MSIEVVATLVVALIGSAGLTGLIDILATDLVGQLRHRRRRTAAARAGLIGGGAYTVFGMIVLTLDDDAIPPGTSGRLTAVLAVLAVIFLIGFATGYLGRLHLHRFVPVVDRLVDRLPGPGRSPAAGALTTRGHGLATAVLSAERRRTHAPARRTRRRGGR